MPRWPPCWRKALRRSEFSCDSPMSLAYPRKRKRRWRSPCWLTRRGTDDRRMCPPPQAQSVPRCWERSRMREKRPLDLGLRTSDLRWPLPTTKVRRHLCILFFTLLSLIAIFPLLSCSAKPDPNTLVMIIESSPMNLDPRVGLDAYSARIDALLFDGLVTRGDQLKVVPGLAERWEIPDLLTYVFHLHHGVRFHDGRPLTARDVKWTLDSLLQGKIRSTKAAVYRFVDHIDATDDFTIIFHLKQPFATLLWNLSDGAMGIVPYGS